MKKKIIVVFSFLIMLFGSLMIVNATTYKLNSIGAVSNPNNKILIDSPLFTSKEKEEIYNQPAVDLAADGFDLKLSNTNYEMYSNKDNCSLRVKNKKTGFVWATDILNISQYGFNNAQRRKAQAAFEIVYRDVDTKIKKVLASDSQTSITQAVSGNKITFKVTTDTALINFSYIVELTNNGIEILMPWESVKELGTNKITSISFYPYLGATYKETIPGYMFIPSGNGGLVRFDKTPSINTSFMSSYFGSDANRIKNNESDVLALPIYGVAQGVGQNAMLAEIKSGATFATFTYSPSSIDQNFNMAYNTFNLRETYMLDIPGATAILMTPEEYYHSDIHFNYSFLGEEEADYIGMAKVYQQSLVKDKVLTKDMTSGSLKVHIDAFGGEEEESILFSKYHKMTTTKQLLDINSELKDKGVDNILYTLRGFNNNGYSKQSATNIKFSSNLGRLSDLDELEAYMYYNPVESYSSKNKQPSNVLVNMYNEKNYITVEADKKYKFYANVDAVANGTKKALDKYDHVALDGLGYRLYGDKNKKYTREEAYQKYQTLITKKLPLFKPNAYLLSSTSEYLNMQLYHDRLKFITDSVPFLQIVLRGYMDYYSQYLNFSTNQEIDFLKCIEYGSNLAYLVSHEQSYKLANTLASNLYATHYESNKSLIIEQNRQIKDALGSVVGQEIVDRVVLQSGIVKVVYANNTSVYVNYTTSDYLDGTIEIPAMGYKVVK